MDEIYYEENLGLLDSLYAPDNADMTLKYKVCIHYLCKIKEPDLILTNSRAYRVIRFLNEFSEDNDELVRCTVENKNIIDVFISSLKYYLSEIKVFLASFSKNSKTKVSEEQEQIYLDEFDFIEELIYLIRNLTNKSKSLCYKFHDNNGTKTILEYLDDDSLVKRLFKFKIRKSSSIKEIGFKFLLGLLGTLLNISYIVDYRRKSFEDLQATEVVLKFVEYIKNNDSARLLAYVTLANIVNEDDIENLLDTKQAIEDLINLIRIGIDNILNQDNLKRIRVDVDFDEDKEILEDVCVVNDDFNILDILLALYRLAINDKLKPVIFDDYNIKSELEKLFLNGNDTEKEYGAKLLWQLCFDKSIAKSVQESETLFSCIQDLAGPINKCTHLKRYCEGIVWSVSKFEQKAQIEQLNRNAAEIMLRTVLPNIPNLKSQGFQAQGYQAQGFQHPHVQSQPVTKGKHIMISYNGQSREDCLKIKTELEKLGYKIWIDVENISGSSLEAMANAIENSQCVLMCMSEKYKLSPNCRAEAEYAFKVGVPIIPLIMQLDYSPDGWLGIILGSKIFVNFKKYPFEECMRRLLLELKPVVPIFEVPIAHEVTPIQTQIQIPNKTNDFQKPLEIKNNVKNWTVEDVDNWCSELNFDLEIKEQLKGFNGELLIQLYDVKKHSPDYFYESISQKNKINLFSVMYFVNEFQKLFK